MNDQSPSPLAVVFPGHPGVVLDEEPPAGVEAGRWAAVRVAATLLDDEPVGARRTAFVGRSDGTPIGMMHVVRTSDGWESST